MLQRRLLESEGVAFSGSGRIDMKEFAWSPDPEVQRDPDRDRP